MSVEVPLVETRGLGRIYRGGGADVVALADVDLTVAPASLLVVRGRSGSGKTTLLNLLGGLDTPTSGTVAIDGARIDGMSERDLASLRRSMIGFVFQSFGLLPILTAAENVELPMRMRRAAPAARRERAMALLERVGLADRAAHRPPELSGGEQQRVAIARALANEPRLILADEPTGQLDSRTANTVMDLFTTVVRDDGIAAVIVTHEPAHDALADSVAELVDGRLQMLSGSGGRCSGSPTAG